MMAAQVMLAQAEVLPVGVKVQGDVLAVVQAEVKVQGEVFDHIKASLNIINIFLF